MKTAQAPRRVWMCIGAAFVALALTGCTRKPTTIPLPPPTVTAALPVRRDVVEWDEFTGRLEAKESVEVRARVSGFIDKSEFEEGAIVTAGTVLFEIDPRPFQVALARAEADLARANAELTNQVSNFDRLQDAVRKNAASPKELEDAERDRQMARAGVDAATAAVDAAKLDLEWTKVHAPIAGRVSRKLVTPGNLITGGPGQSTLLTVITSIDPMYCYFDADERSVLKYKRLAREGTRDSARNGEIPCHLQLADDEPYFATGFIDFVDNRLDPATGTIQYRAVFSNAQRRLVPGFFARVRVPGSGIYSTLLVPDSALGVDQDRRYLTIVNAEGVIERKNVTTGALFGRLRAILQGLNDNDRVVINGLVRALPGAKVNVQAGEIAIEGLDIVLPDKPAAPAAAAPPTTAAPASAPVVVPAGGPR